MRRRRIVVVLAGVDVKTLFSQKCKHELKHQTFILALILQCVFLLLKACYTQSKSPIPVELQGRKIVYYDHYDS